ncbi:hypothetical protein DSM106044_05298 [Robinsoniella peoriensis]|uniref:Uncharacterized protein n=2 Tax=Robinsoniella peoriensis TaxID=180332 RepID=A0A4U8Q1B6_9FIRM|nr:hypothetical protein DSM106044_05298 [Robinsoniella peoriensis]
MGRSLREETRCVEMYKNRLLRKWGIQEIDDLRSKIVKLDEMQNAGKYRWHIMIYNALIACSKAIYEQGIKVITNTQNEGI